MFAQYRSATTLGSKNGTWNAARAAICGGLALIGGLAASAGAQTVGHTDINAFYMSAPVSTTGVPTPPYGPCLAQGVPSSAPVGSTIVFRVETPTSGMQVQVLFDVNPCSSALFQILPPSPCITPLPFTANQSQDLLNPQVFTTVTSIPSGTGAGMASIAINKPGGLSGYVLSAQCLIFGNPGGCIPTSGFLVTNGMDLFL